MYARYIPSPKPPSQAPRTAQLPSSSSAAPYARYVPPPKREASALTSNSASVRPAPFSKIHLNAAATPNSEAVPAKIVFNYDEDEPLPPEKRHLDNIEPVAESSKKKQKIGDHHVKKRKNRRQEKQENTRKPTEDHDEKSSAARKAGKERKRKEQEGRNISSGFDESIFESKGSSGKGVASTNDMGSIIGSEKKHMTVEGTTTEEACAIETAPKQKAEASGSILKAFESTKKEKKVKDKDIVKLKHKLVLERASKYLNKAGDTKTKQTSDGEDVGAVELHGLEPLPQPEPLSMGTVEPTYETLPSWIAHPIRVTPTTKASFTDLGMSEGITEKLRSKGYKYAFAVQTAVIPLLLPTPDRQGDVVVSAATGSGKTLAYVLPMIKDISQDAVTRLRALIVVPTRELVLQAKEVCEACVGAFSSGSKTVRIGISMGNKRFKQEQADLIEEDQRFDPQGHRDYSQTKFGKDSCLQWLDESPTPLPDHVFEYNSKVDILICTPGRLVDHISRTPGFVLDYVRWLVVDEADKLLAQAFQEWLPKVMPLLSSTTTILDARDFPFSNKSCVRKVVLSATMTRDLTLLDGLKLYRPRLVVLEGVGDDVEETRKSKTKHVLPVSLEEAAIKIRDPNLKPLYLVDLLDSQYMVPTNAAEGGHSSDVVTEDAGQEGSSSAESYQAEAFSNSEENGSDEPGRDSADSEACAVISTSRNPAASRGRHEPFRTTVLIFTKSNETAVRLSRLLCLLSTKLSSSVGTLTSTTRTSQRRKILQSFAQGQLRILVASDLVARGIDLVNLDHVINYDMPASVASYVHRVGRTARAGRKGRAWTLFTKTEAGWFWTAIAGKGESKDGASQVKIARGGKVEQLRIEDRWGEAKLQEFESALAKLAVEATKFKRRS